jgi:hypothetical protein
MKALTLIKPETVFAACYENGKMPLLNFDGSAAVVDAGGRRFALDPYEIKII